jgi:hypothetical protein
MTPCPVILHQVFKMLRFCLSGDQFLDEGYIDTNAVRDAARPDFMGVKFGHNMNLLFPGMCAHPGITVGRRRRAVITAGGIVSHEQLLTIHISNAKRRRIMACAGHK